jgi:hypothetical protein
VSKARRVRGLFVVKLPYNAQTAEVGIQTPEKSGCERSPADNSLRFLPTNGQTGMYGSPIHRQLCMSPESTSITRAQAQCHDFRCNQHTAVASKFGSSHVLRRNPRNEKHR